MVKKLIEFLRRNGVRSPVQLVGVIASLVLGVLLYFVEGIGPAVIAIVAGLTLAVYVELIDFREDLQEDLSLYDQARTHGIRKDIHSAIQAMVQVVSQRDPLFEKAAKRRLDDAIQDLGELSRGTLRIVHPTELTLTAIKLSERMSSLLASSLWSEGDPASRNRARYLELQRQAIHERGASVRRIFILAEADVGHPDLIERMRDDARDGVEVRWLIDSDWLGDATLAAQAADLGVWDGDLVWRYLPVAADENRHWEARVIRDPGLVKKYTDLFYANWQVSHPLETMEATARRSGPGQAAD